MAPALRRVLSTLQNKTQLFNYLSSDINSSGNERLHALTAQQKCMPLCCGSKSHSSLCSHNMSQLAYGSPLPTKWHKIPRATRAGCYLSLGRGRSCHRRKPGSFSAFFPPLFVLCNIQRNVACDCVRQCVLCHA